MLDLFTCQRALIPRRTSAGTQIEWRNPQPLGVRSSDPEEQSGEVQGPLVSRDRARPPMSELTPSDSRPHLVNTSNPFAGIVTRAEAENPCMGRPLA